MPLYPPFSARSRERAPSPNFSQLYIVGPSSEFNKGLRSASDDILDQGAHRGHLDDGEFHEHHDLEVRLLRRGQ